MNLAPGYYTHAPALQGVGPGGLAARVVEALEDPPAASALAGSREWVERNHSLEIAVETLAAIYRKVAGN